MVPDALIHAVADLEFDLQKKLFSELGSVSPSIRGYRAKNGKITTVNTLKFDGNFPERYKTLVDKMLLKFPVVSAVLEVWETDFNTQKRTEAVVINIHTASKVWNLRCGIERAPSNELVKGELSALTSALGRMMEDRPTHANAKAITKEVKALLLGSNEHWAAFLASKMARLVEDLGDIKPFTDALYEADIPTEKLRVTTAMLEELMTVTHSPSGVDGEDELEVLLGVDVSLPKEQDEGCDVSLLEIIAAVHANITEECSTVGLDVASDPEGELAIIGPFFPVSMAYALKNMARTWSGPAASIPINKQLSAGQREWFQQQFDRDYQEFVGGDMRNEVCLTLPVSISIRIPAGIAPMTRLVSSHQPDPAVASVIEQATTPIRLAVERAIGKLGLKGRFNGVGRIYDRLRVKHLVDLHCRLQHLLSLAVVSSAERGDTTAVQQMQAVVGAAEFSRPSRHEKVLVSVFSGGNVCLPIALQRLPYWNLSDYRQVVVDLLRECGLVGIDVSTDVSKQQEQPHDSFGAPMYLDGKGSWFSPIGASIPHALGVVQTLGWDFFSNDDSSDPHVLSLPAPHMMQRLGAAAVMQRHFSPETYSIVKDALSSDARSIEQCWDLARSRHVGLDKLAKTHDFAVFPPEIVGLSLQLQWSRSPTITVRSTLTERLRHTDLSSKLRTSAVNTPFLLQYVHFSSTDPVAEIRLTYDEKDYRVELAGAFVRRLNTQEGRDLDVRLVWRNPDDPLHTLISQVQLKLRGGPQTVSECIAHATQEVDYETDDVRTAELAALDELFKVLFYMASKQARVVKMDERATTLKDLGRRSPEQQQKLLARSRAIYDHILVGPEHAFDSEANMDGVTRRQTKVSIRRGHLHGYWRGTGRTEYIVHLLDPIVVNKHLLGDGDSPPDPKNYTIH